MLKIDELKDLYSCINRARADEMVFVLLERDVCSAETIRFWAAKRIERGKNRPEDPQITEALKAADYIERKYSK